MIIHVWMHWFWITSSFKCFLFIALQMISSSCVSYPFAAGAGLLNNESLAFDNFTMYNLNESSQMDREESVPVPSTSSSLLSSSSSSSSSTSAISSFVPLLPSSSPISPVSEDSVETEVKASEKVASSTDETTILPEVSNSSISSSSSSSEETANSSIPRDFSSREATLDIDDTYNGGNFDVYQLPTEKSAKYSHSKYGKVKTISGNDNEKEERGEVLEEVKEKVVEEEKSIETIKLVEEKINISLSDEETTANGTESLEPTIVSPLLNYTLDAGNGTKEMGNRSAAGHESTDSGKFKNVTVASQVPSTNVSYQTDGNGTNVNVSQVLEDQEDVEDTYKNGSLVIENKVEESVIHTTVEPFPLRNRVAAATSSQTFDLSQSGMNAGSVTGIILGVLVIFGLSGAISFVLYRRRYLNKPQVLHDKCSNLDSSGYIDDASLKENSEEMYSLDNDSFLNSLEAMTIQNYWTESVKHTKL